MLLDNITPVQEKDMFCFESAVAIVTSHLKRRYEMIFINAWKFDFSPKNSSLRQTNVSNVDMEYVDNWEIVNLLEKYHGIRITPYKKVKNVMRFLSNEMEKGYPVLVSSINAKDISPILVIGLDENRKEIDYIDLHSLYKDVSTKVMNTGNLWPGSMSCVTYSLISEEKKEIDWRQIIIDSAKQLSKSGNKANPLDAIRALAEYIRASFDLSAEMKRKENPLEIYIVQKIETAARSRFLFSKALHYLLEVHNIHGLPAIIDKFVELSNQWHLIKYLITKSFYSHRVDETFYGNIADKILEIADLEAELSNMLLNVARTDIETSAINLPENKPAPDSSVNEITFVDLRDYLNNRGFGTADNVCGADLSGLGQFFLRNETCEMEKWSVSQMEFGLPLVASNNYDNISCIGQTIYFVEGCYKSIMLLGCSVLGCFSEKALVHYENGDVEEVPIEFTNFVNQRPLFGEAIAWNGGIVEKKDHEMVISNNTGYLFAKTYYFKHGEPMKSITLPDYPNIHIFAISLGK